MSGATPGKERLSRAPAPPHPASSRRGGFLRGLSVLELGDGVAGAAAAATLAAFGASVSTVVRRGAPHRRFRPRVTGREGTDASLLSFLLDRDKDIVELAGCSAAGVEELIRGAGAGGPSAPFDLVIADRVLGPVFDAGELAGADEFADWVGGVNPNAWVTISAFGLSGGRRDEFATDLALSAAAGILSSVRDPRSGRPLKLGGCQALLAAGQAGALAACHALDLAGARGRAHLDLSAQEATIAMGPMLTLAPHLLNCTGPGGANRFGAPASLYACSDGMVWISAMEDHQWQGVVSAIGSPAWTQGCETRIERIARLEEIDAGIAAWTSGRSKREVETLLQASGVPANALYSPSEILDSPQLAYRGAITSSQVLDGVEVRSIGQPFTQLPRTEHRTGVPRHRSLRGLRVLEIGHVLALPLAASLLGALGADVTKLEDIKRIDMYRRRGPFIDGVEGNDRAAYFALANHSKDSVTVDAEADPDALTQLLEQTDVVMENVGIRRSNKLGVSASAINQSHPELLAVSSSGFGHQGPHSAYRAYAYNLQTSCGLVYLTGNETGERAEMMLAWGDLISAYALATIVAAWAVGPAGNTGAGVDFAMADLITARFNEFIAAASIDPTSDARFERANDTYPFAPNGVYETTDGWIAISVDGDAQFEHLRTALGDATALHDARFSTSDGRFAARRELDSALAEAIAGRERHELAHSLRAVGIIAEPLLSPEQMLGDSHLTQRGFFPTVNHPEWGRRHLIGIPWRLRGERPIPLRAPPLFEAHTPRDASPLPT